MDRLTSCYFCGTALDAPVDEYPVVPGELHPSLEDQATVTLCPTCRRKLTAILDSVLDSVADRVALPDATGDDEPPELSASLGDAPDLPELGGEPEERTRPTGDSEDAEAAAGRELGLEASAGGRQATDRSDAEPGSGAEPDAPTDGNGGDGREPSSGGTNDDRGSSSADGDASGSPGAAGGPRTEDGSGTAVLGTPAAKKVVRLLQNREFPVDRGEIEVVASNAYDIPPRDCEAVVEALVEGDYVDERDGQLVQSEG